MTNVACTGESWEMGWESSQVLNLRSLSSFAQSQQCWENTWGMFYMEANYNAVAGGLLDKNLSSLFLGELEGGIDGYKWPVSRFK